MHWRNTRRLPGALDDATAAETEVVHSATRTQHRLPPCLGTKRRAFRGRPAKRQALPSAAPDRGRQVSRPPAQTSSGGASRPSDRTDRGSRASPESGSRPGFRFVAFITDMLRRRTVGWAASGRRHTAGLPLLVLVHPLLSTDAIRGRQGRVQHGDWASQ